MVNQAPTTGGKIKRCLDRETTEERFECAVNEIAIHADHVDKTMDSIGKELGSLQNSVSLLPTRDDVNAIVDAKVVAINAKIGLLPTKKDLAAESKKVIDAFNKKLGAEVKGIVAEVDSTRDALTRAVDDSISKVNARLDTMATKNDIARIENRLDTFATKDDLDKRFDAMDKKIDDRFDDIKGMISKISKK
jgi:uncharacterized protein YicC (UPF0701 family)